MRKHLFIYSFVLFSLFSTSPLHADDTDMRKSYAVMWTIDTDDTELYKNTLVDQASKMVALWHSGTIENVYIDNTKSEIIVNKGDVGKVMFFIKAQTEKEAKTILNELPLIKKKIATYKLYPVGVLWLKQY